MARDLMYRSLPVSELPVAPEAQYFPGLPPAGTQPSDTPITATVRSCPGHAVLYLVALRCSTC